MSRPKTLDGDEAEVADQPVDLEPEVPRPFGKPLSLKLPVVSGVRWLLPLALLLAGAVLFAVNARHQANADGAVAARKVVTAHVEELLTYDYKTIDSDLAKERPWLTGSFATDYSKLVAGTIAPAATKDEITTRAVVSAGGVISEKHHEVSLLLFVNVSTQSPSLPEARVSGSRLRVTAKYVDGAWRVSALDPV